MSNVDTIAAIAAKDTVLSGFAVKNEWHKLKTSYEAKYGGTRHDIYDWLDIAKKVSENKDHVVSGKSDSSATPLLGATTAGTEPWGRGLIGHDGSEPDSTSDAKVHGSAYGSSIADERHAADAPKHVADEPSVTPKN